MKSGINASKSDKFVSSLLSKMLGPGLTFLDVGAYRGELMVAAAAFVTPTGRVYAFDTGPTSASRSVEVVPDNVEVVTSGVLGGNADNPHEEVNAGSISLDDFFKKRNWPPVHVVKIDYDSAGIAVLNDMKELCRRNSAIKVIVTLNKSHSTSPDADFDKLWAALRGCGLFHVRVIGKIIRECRIPEDLPGLINESACQRLSFLCEAPFAESPSMKEGDQIITSLAKLIPAGRLKKALAKLFDRQVFLFNRFGLYDLNYYKKYHEFRKGDVVVDAGAHRGLCTVGLARLVGKTGKVIAIEPDPDNLKELRKVTGHLSNVIIIGKGVWSSKNTMKLYAHQFDYGHSLFKNLVGAKETYETVEVEVDTLDHILSELGVNRVNFIKMNIEGAEIEALKGANQTLAGNYLSLAIEAQHEVNGEPTNKSILSLLEKAQFSTFLGPKGEVYAQKHW